ncbi:hypothetical protein COY52_02890 [Candidatus Desantisbacteria bacterium CG_4_10_14_0_8_um_filter_48_22]|uniref:Response regulatory domain-containing protein n=1 Tax=Candidatus Desantisbacteria bacterium CG_4_10_14_0_8_um_filter_48_22 TaxID=1974543 RepID=A0A2M7SE28_9BACT|nr:MAG: hypothetical protein AUJ67_02345 [Candidatus Desantisbacteria bacterium CG1_02_49_89]PIV57450.1 MAG: hypothetical protein COS16_00185 [Candidatus Desantisbacteria bacterium CG02_land_8_20_14_3_00_49_13]PIZ17768.1 MAG: hypothetical protein COY52_02890 [Candidatus Desantisbacteria bacterium CG_4_10_14_0_8_um_filter_48_22]
MQEEKSRLNILVVDDDPSVFGIFKRIFGNQHSLSIAMSADEALRMAGFQLYNLIFLDYMLPDKDGVSVLEDLKKTNPEAIVILISGYDISREIKKAFSKGAQEFLPKPVDVDKIMNIKEVAEYLKLHHLTVYRLAQKGKIPFSKIGRSWRIKKDMLDKWVKQEAGRIGHKAGKRKD